MAAALAKDSTSPIGTAGGASTTPGSGAADPEPDVPAALGAAGTSCCAATERRRAGGTATLSDGASDEQRITVPAAEGRVLEVLVAGPEDGLPLVFHTGTPSGLVGTRRWPKRPRRAGCAPCCTRGPVTVVPTPQPGRLVADAAADVDEDPGPPRCRTNSSPQAGPAVARTRWPARPCCPVRCLAAATDRRGRASTTARAWTGWPAWPRRTTGSSAPRWRGRRT